MSDLIQPAKKIFTKSNLIIISLVSFFSLQYLVYISIFSVNFPYSSDVPDIVFFTYDFIKTGQFDFFGTASGHLFVIPRIISFFNLYYNSFDIINIIYFQWVIISITVFLTYLLLKQTDRKLSWVIIPISAFLYCPLAYSNYFSVSTLPWYLVTLSITSIVYFTNKNNFKNIGVGTSFAILSSLSTIIGIISWIPGLIVTLGKTQSIKNLFKNKLLIFWIGSMVVFGIVYTTLIPDGEHQLDPKLLFSPEGYFFITTYLASAFRVKYDILFIVIGSLSLFLSIFCIYFFLKIRGKISDTLPWFTFCAVGIVGAVFTAIGRLHLEGHFGDDPYYITISQFFQIGLLVLVAKMFVETRKISKNKIIIILFISIIILQMILLVPSYYAGWQRGEYYMIEKEEYANCYSLSPDMECSEKIQFSEASYPFNKKYFEMVNYWIENDLSIFADTKYNEGNQSDVSEYLLTADVETVLGLGSIEKINQQKISENSKILLEDEVLVIEGWMISPKQKQLDSIYLLIDDTPLTKVNYFKQVENISEKYNNSELKAGWNIFLMAGYLDYGCHDLSVVGFKDDLKITLNNKIQICK